MSADPQTPPEPGAPGLDPRAQPLAGPELATALLNFVQQAANVNALRAGANEALKLAAKGHCSLVVLAADAVPLEIVLHLPLVCEEKGVPYVFLPSKKALGNASGRSVDVIACGVAKHSSLDQTAERLVREVEALV